MQKFSYELITAVSKSSKIFVIAWGKSQIFLPFFLLYALLKAIYIIVLKQVEVVHLGDAVLSPLGIILRKLFHIPILVTVYGLDITYPAKIYQYFIPKLVNKCDKIVCISKQTQNECLKRNISKEKTVVIPIGVNAMVKTAANLADVREIEKHIYCAIESKVILLTVGRLVKRKGVRHFLSEAFPKIVAKNKNVIYFIVGNGEEYPKIKKAIKKLNLEKNVFLFRQVKKELLDTIYKISNIFIMPNIPVKGDMEGFGIVALEACVAGLPVVASKLEGIQDAISDGENGFLVNYDDNQSFVNIILRLTNNPKYRKEIGEKARLYTLNKFNWQNVANRYIDVFNSLKEPK
ncbi:MAG: glycosyltransferase family 4 protein [Candidatus Omnitrophica bacterium]|nr:glycosyltransferase family 4 protein [Candidatus Omnitrophota bacterium]